MNKRGCPRCNAGREAYKFHGLCQWKQCSVCKYDASKEALAIDVDRRLGRGIVVREYMIRAVREYREGLVDLDELEERE